MATTGFRVNNADIDTLYIDKTYIYTSADNFLWSWGNNGNYALGLGDNTNRSSPVQIGTTAAWKSVDAGTYSIGGSTYGIKTDGSLWAWGFNVWGQLGLNNTSNQVEPTQVGTDKNWLQVAGGYTCAYAIKTNGTLWAWGQNGQRLGLNDNTNRSSPVQIGTGTDWAWVGSQYNGGYAIKNNGTLWAWGAGGNGQLGQNAYNSTSSPIQVGSGTDWSRVDGGEGNALATKTNGTLWHIGGRNLNGESGLNISTNDLSSPTQIGTGTNWSLIGIGRYHCLAVKTDGTLWSWGANANFGGLGLNDTTPRSSPVQVGSGTNWSKVSAGFAFSIATKTDGTLWTWGVNNYGQLGQGNTTRQSSPIQVGSGTTWANVSLGYSNSFALRYFE